MSKIKIVGVSKFVSKKGNDVCMLHLIRQYSREENASGKYGCEAISGFAPYGTYSEFTADDVNKEVDVRYGYVDGKTILYDVQIKN